jgi:hypothetical protein
MAQRLSFHEFPRHVSRAAAGHVTIAMFNQPGQAGMRDVLHRGDLALYAILLMGMEVQFQCYNVIRRSAVWLRNPGCPENYSLPAHGNLAANDVSMTQSSFDFCGLKRVDIHRIYQERLRSVCGYVSFPHDATEAFHRVHPRMVHEEMFLTD